MNFQMPSTPKKALVPTIKQFTVYGEGGRRGGKDPGLNLQYEWQRVQIAVYTKRTKEETTESSIRLQRGGELKGKCDHIR